MEDSVKLNSRSDSFAICLTKLRILWKVYSIKETAAKGLRRRLVMRHVCLRSKFRVQTTNLPLWDAGTGSTLLNRLFLSLGNDPLLLQGGG